MGIASANFLCWLSCMTWSVNASQRSCCVLVMIHAHYRSSPERSQTWLQDREPNSNDDPLTQTKRYTYGPRMTMYSMAKTQKHNRLAEPIRLATLIFVAGV